MEYFSVMYSVGYAISLSSEAVDFLIIGILGEQLSINVFSQRDKFCFYYWETNSSQKLLCNKTSHQIAFFQCIVLPLFHLKNNTLLHRFHFWPRWCNKVQITFLPETTTKLERNIWNNSFQDNRHQAMKDSDVWEMRFIFLKWILYHWTEIWPGIQKRNIYETCT